MGVLKLREFRLLFGAQAVSVLGDRMVAIALAFAVIEQSSGTLIGDAGLYRTPAGEVELGYTLGKAWWGRGYATEAARACVTLALRHSDVPEVVALIRPENGPSMGVARRVGMSRAGCVLHAGLVHDVWRLTREAFEADTLQ